MKKRMALLLLLTIIATGVLVSLAIGFYASHSLQATIEESLATFHKNLRHRFEAFVVSVKKEERSVADKMKRELPRITADLLAINKNPAAVTEAELRAIVKRYGFTEFYLIDRKGVIVNTTFAPDKGFDLTTINERFAQKLRSLYGKGEVFVDSMVLSSKTGILNVYGYYSPPGSRWIYEVSMNLRDHIANSHGEAYADYLFHHFFLDPGDRETPITDLDFYMINNLVAWSIVHEGERMDAKLRMALYDKPEHRIVEGDKLVIYSRFDPPETEGVFNQEYRTKVTMDIRQLRNIPIEVGLAVAVSLFVILPLSFFLATRAMDRTLIKPLDRLLRSLERIGAGDYGMPAEVAGVSEMRRIAEVANHMKDEIVRREQALRESRDLLEQRVMERTRELARAKDEAEAATRIKDKFISLVSHDIRGPLSTILGSLQLIEEDKRRGGAYPDNAGSLMRNALESLNGLLEMTGRLLDISLLQTGKIVPEMRLHHVWTVVERDMQRMQLAAGMKELKLLNLVDPKQRLVMDDKLFGEMLLNLLSNAVKFTPRGGEIAVFSPSPFAVAVRDTGKGMPPQYLPDLFKHEVKTTAFGTEGERGTGLGLPFCRDIMEAHGGAIACETGEGGTTFTLAFSSARPAALIAGANAEERAALAQRVAHAFSVEVLQAESGEAALALARELRPILVITELDLPGMGHGELIRKMREERWTAHIPVVVCASPAPTADASAPDGFSPETFALELGAEGFLPKPVSPEGMAALLTRYLP